MGAKKKSVTKSRGRKRDSVNVATGPGDDRGRILAKALLHPSIQAASTVRRYSKNDGDDGPDLKALVAELQAEISATAGGSLERAEAMLVAQAHTLDAIFGNLARRAAVAEYLPQLETYLRLALKAQSQCRATWESLAEIKHPRSVAFVGQANIAHGPQQVNNAPVKTPEPSRAGESEYPQTKLLERTDGERLDTGAAGETGRANTSVEALEAVHGTEDRGR